MEKVVVDDATLAYEVSGTGEPGILIPGALIAEAFRPLLAEPNLVGGYQLIIYHRHEYWGSTRASRSVNMAQQVVDCRGLARHLGIQRAHFVGHSLGGSICVQLAMETPDLAHSLALWNRRYSEGRPVRNTGCRWPAPNIASKKSHRTLLSTTS